jgi:DNA-binding NarL/FixJ family response regulator
MAVRVVIADDHPMFRYGLRAVLEQSDGIDVVGDAGDGETLLALARELSPDVVVTDLSMAGLDGVAVISALAEQSPPVPVLAVTMHEDDEHIRAALRAGARGYVLKGADGDGIANAVRAVAAGQSALDPSVTKRLVVAYAGGDDPGRHAFPELTPREIDTLRLIAAGCRNHEIARRLGVSEKTVRNVTSAVLLKLGVPDRTAAALRARDAGLSVADAGGQPPAS